MKKVLIASILIFTLSAAHSAFISDIKIEGNRNVKTKQIRKQIKSKEGKPYAEEKITSDIQGILSLGHFKDVEVFVDTDTYRVVFHVKEKPYIKQIKFKGNKQLKTGKIKSELSVKEKDFFTTGDLTSAKKTILSLYHDKGYADCNVELVPTTDEETNFMTVTFLIDEGNRILIGDVQVTGTKAYKPKKIRKKMKTKRKKVYKEETFIEDRAKIEEYYKSKGYFHINIQDPIIVYNEERTKMSITVPIEEGPRYRLGNVSFAGNTVFDNDELRDAFYMKEGRIFKDEDYQDGRMSIYQLYSNKGYLNCRIDPELTADKEKARMNIHFNLEENGIVYMGRLYIEGLNNTKEIVIKREVVLKPGDVFSASKVRRSVEKIYNLGFIDGVEPDVQPTDEKNIMDLVLNITEGKPGMLSVGAGYSSIDQLVGTLQAQHINLLGRAQKLNLMWEFGARRQNYEVDWTEPWFLNKPTSLGFRVFNTQRSRDYGTTFSAYKEGRRGGSIRLGPRLSDYLSLLFSCNYEEISVFDVAPALRDTIEGTNDVTSSLTSQVIWDTRDNIFDPSRGNRQAFSVQVAGGPLGGNVDYVKPIVKSSWFFPSFWKFVWSFNTTLGLIENFGNSKSVPIYERFYVGGADTIRGYEYRSEIGPSEGGKSMAVFNLEYKFPIVREKKRTMVQGAFFVDMGGSWLNPGDFTLEVGSGQDQVRAGAGFGIRFTTPVFPLRLDWGYGFNHKPGEELSQFYFTMGNMF